MNVDDKIIVPEVIFYEGKFQKGKAIWISHNKIFDIVSSDLLFDKKSNVQIEYWDNMAVIPGTINIHNHCFQSLLRGIGVGRPFLEWRDETLYKISPMLSPDDLYTGALFAFGEMMKYGVTTVCDYFYVHNNGIDSDQAIIDAARDVGLRLVLARTMYDWSGAPSGYVEDIETAVKTIKLLANKYNESEDLMTNILPAPHSLHAASPEMIKRGYQLAKELNTKFHIHVAEEPFEVNDILNKYGMRPVEYFEHLGLLDKSMVMVHAVWLNEVELSLLGKQHVSLAYCPSSNMFLADGVTRIDKMLDYGIQIGLGTDGACSNNRISVFEEMRMASLLQKVTRLDASLVNTETAFRMGTSWGGQILDLPIGEIQIGNKADLVGLNIKDLSLQPLYPDYEQLLPNIVYSMQPSAIARVMVNGKTTVKDNHIMTIPEKIIEKRVSSLMSRIYINSFNNKIQA